MFAGDPFSSMETDARNPFVATHDYSRFLARLLILLKKWAFAIEVRRRRRQLLLVGSIT